MRHLLSFMIAVFLLIASRAAADTLTPGDILVVDNIMNEVIPVNPTTGVQAAVYTGGLLSTPSAIAIDASGDFLVPTRGAPGSVIRVTPAGVQTPISSGGNFASPAGIAIDASGDILIADDNTPGFIRVVPGTGASTVLSSSANFSQSRGIVVVSQQAAVPATLLLLSTGLVGLVGASRLRKP